MGRLARRTARQLEADGRWDAAYDSPSTVTVPDDLRREVERNDAARESFDALRREPLRDSEPGSCGEEAETRARRIEKFVAMLERRETPYP